MQKFITKLALASLLFTGVLSTTNLINAQADAVKQAKPVKLSNQSFDHQANKYMKLLNQSAKTDLIKELIKSGKPSSISDLGSKIALHSDNQAATNAQEAKSNSIFYLKLNHIFKQYINHDFQCDDGNKLSTNLKALKTSTDFNSQATIEKTSMTGMGLGDSMDFGNRNSN